MDYEESIRYISEFPRFKKEPSLESIRLLLDALGNPERGIKAIHVAGTNGKGSTVTMLQSILTAAGYKTGRYVSPYVLEFRERMTIGGKMIGRKRLAAIMTRVSAEADRLIERGKLLNAFEVTTAAAFLWFYEENCDFVVVEAGLGGRLDATNTIPEPVLQIITAVGLDHMEVLGDTIGKIAAEKCGILRKGCNFLTSPGQDPEALAVMTEKAMEYEATFTIAPRDIGMLFSESAEGTELLVGKTELWIPLAGRHQLSNVSTVLSAVDILRENHIAKIRDEDVLNGIASVRFPARFEMCCSEPLVILDGAHNPQAAKALAENVEAFLPRKRKLLCGMMADKDCNRVMEILAPHFGEVICVPVQSPRAIDPGDLSELAGTYCGRVSVKSDAREALDEVLEGLEKDESLVVAGSLYLASELRPQLMRYNGIV